MDPASTPEGSSSSTQVAGSRSAYPSRTEKPAGGSRGTARGEHNEISNLTPGSLYLVLHSRLDLPEEEGMAFHSGFYLHIDAKRGGWKMHIRNMGSGQTWMADYAITTGIFRSLYLVGLVRICAFPLSDVEVISNIIKEDDSRLNQTPGMTCHMWVSRACERLHQAGRLKCTSIPDLEREIFAFGCKFWDDTNQNLQPRPFMDSEVCQI